MPMTNREAITLTWRKFGMTEAQIADGLKQHALRRPGTLEQLAPFSDAEAPAVMDALILQMHGLEKLFRMGHGEAILKLMDEAERDINSGN